MATAMEHSNQLLYRNAELEAELRIVKEQLEQARKSTNYLLERISIAETPRTSPELQHLQTEHDQALRENAHLKDMLRLTRDGHSPASRRIVSRTLYGVRRILRSDRGRSQSSTYRQQAESVATKHGNLLDLEDDSTPSATATPAYTTIPEPTPTIDSSEDETTHFPDIPAMVGRPIRHKKIGNTSVGLGINGTESFDSQETELSEGDAIPPGKQSGFWTFHDGQAVFFKTPILVDADPPRGPRNFRVDSRGPAHFFAHEHRSLAGNAVFIEGMTPDEQEERWNDLAKKSPRHSAAEWKTYYFENVRPVYLAAEAAKEAAKNNAQATAAEKVEVTAKEEASPKQHEEPKQLPETSFTSAITNPDEILLGEEEEVQVDSSFNTTTTTSGGVALTPEEEIALNDFGASTEAHTGSVSTASTQASESAPQPAPTSAPAINPLSLSIHAVPSRAEKKPWAFSDILNRTDDDDTAKDTIPSSTAPPKNPFTSMPGYEASIEESKAFRATATLGGQKQRPRRERTEEENVIAPPTPAFGAVVSGGERGDAQSRRDSPQKSTRCGFSRVYYPMNLNDIFHKPRAEDPNAFRTVVISNVPSTMTLAQVLGTVRGGKIFASTYHDTSNFRTTPPTTTNTVTIIFLKGGEAAKFVKHTASHPITFTTSLLDPPTQAEVTLLNTPTRPIPNRLRDIAIPAGLTRMLYLHSLPPNLRDAQDIINKIQSIDPYIPRPLTAGYDKDGIMVLEYASMAEAEMTGMLVSHCTEAFPGVDVGHLGDPCAGALVWKKEGEMKEGEKGEGGEGENGEGELKGEIESVDGVDGSKAEMGDDGGEKEYEGEGEAATAVAVRVGEKAAAVYIDREADSEMMEG